MQTFYTKLADEAYFGLPYLSQSKLKHLVDLNYAQYLSKIEELSNRPYSDEMRLGTIMHSVNLENADIASLTRFKRLDGRTAEGKEQKAKISGLKSYVYEDEINKILTMRDNFKASFHAQALMSKAQFIEHYGVALIHDDKRPDEPLAFKFKPDIVGADFIADYKTIGDYATEKNIRNAIKKSGYDFQAACYLLLDSFLTGSLKQNYYMIFQETIEPFGVQVIKLHDMDLDNAMSSFKYTLQQYIYNYKYTKEEINPNSNEILEIILNYY